MAGWRDLRGGAAAELRLLQRLRQALPQAGTQELAALLQLEVRPLAPSEPAPGPGLSRPPDDRPQRIDPKDQQRKIDYPPADKTLPFLYLHAIEPKPAPTDSSHKPDWYDDTRPFVGDIESPMQPPAEPEPLLTWQQLWPVLHRLFRDRKKTNRLDTQALIRAAVRCEPLTAIPWRRRLRWPGELVLLVDCSPHLAPYYSDYGQVAWWLQRWLRERLKLVICTDCEQQRFVCDGRPWLGLPPWIENTELLYLGDLGFLDRQGIASARWSEAGRELKRRSVRVEALVTADPSDWDVSFMRHYHLHGWDSGRIVSAGPAPAVVSARSAATLQQRDRLMAHLSQALEMTPALVRALRCALGMSVSVESLVFQHPALIGNRICFQWRSSAERDVFRAAFEAQGGDRERTWAIIEGFEAGLPLELQAEQRQQAGRPLSERQREFIRPLIKSLNEGALSDDSRAMLLGWIERMAARAGAERWPEAMRALYALYWQRNKHRPDCIVPEWIDPTRLPQWATGSATSGALVRLLQRGDHLSLAAAQSGDPSPAVELARFEWFEGSALTLSGTHGSDKRALWPDSAIAARDGLTGVVIDTPTRRLVLRSLRCPDWATGLGRDRYGLFAELRIAGVDVVMRWMPPGEFLMGSPPDEPERDEDEGPRHRVRFEAGFWLAETACSQALWQVVMGDNPSRFQDDPDNPVEKVTWEMAKAFIEALNQKGPSPGFRLPSEAEWEYACRAGTTTPFWFGTALTTDDANYNGDLPYAAGAKGEFRKKTVPVKSYRPNPWGLYQMHGNVWEWCEDRWHTSYEGAPDDGSAWIARDSKRHVCRGGSWLNRGRLLRSASRSRGPFDIPGDYGGLRLARGPELQPAQAEGAAAAGRRQE